MNIDMLMVELAREGLEKTAGTMLKTAANPAKVTKALTPPGFFGRLLGGSARYAKKRGVQSMELAQRRAKALRDRQQQLAESGGLLSGMRSRRAGRQADKIEMEDIPNIQHNIAKDIERAKEIDSSTRTNTVLGLGVLGGGGYLANKKLNPSAGGSGAPQYADYSSYGY